MCRHPHHCVVAPYLLDQIARNGTPEQRANALRALALDADLRTRRATAPGVPPRVATAATAGRPRRTIYDAQHAEREPPSGVRVRGEGDPATGDPAVDEAYDGLGATYALFFEVFARDSLDGAGAPLDAYVHFGRDYGNAFWDGSRMVFGDGDGAFLGRMTQAVDVIGHELTHAVTDATAGLAYEGQSGALNESLSDVFGVLVKQRQLGQRADDADWLIGAGLLVEGVRGVALRSMKAPGTAYDDPTIGRDPQPATMADYVETASDNGGVHVNSGIPNHAFYLAATALGGFAWEAAGGVWYAALTSPDLDRRADFARFAELTRAIAVERHGDGSRELAAIDAAWQEVGVGRPTPGAPTGEDRLELVRSGGIAGRSVSVALPLDDVPPGLRATAFRALALGGSQPLGADRYQYDLAITTERRTERVRLHDGDLDDDVRSLFAELLRGR